jgi:hypothetical protein
LARLSQWSDDLAAISLIKGSAPPEIYIPLWWYSGGNVQTNNSSASNYGLAKHTTTLMPNPILHTLNTGWNPTAKFALEVALWTSSTSAPANAALVDVTTGGTVITASQITTTSTTATVLRSAQVTLTNGHAYGVAVWSSNGGTAYITDASLIVFP